MLEEFGLCNDIWALLGYQLLQLRCYVLHCILNVYTAVDLNGINQITITFKSICQTERALESCIFPKVICDFSVSQQENNVLPSRISARNSFNGFERSVCVRFRLVRVHWTSDVVYCVHCCFDIIDLAAIQVACVSFSIVIKAGNCDTS